MLLGNQIGRTATSSRNDHTRQDKMMMMMMMMMVDDDKDDYDDDDDDRMMMLAHGWRPPRGGKRAQRDNCP